MSTIRKLVALLFILSAGLLACARGAAPPLPLTPVAVQLLWTHNAQFAGFYAADQKGYYADTGLTVTSLQGGSTVDYLTPIANGAAQFSDAGADELLSAWTKGKPLRALATIYRHSSRALDALADSGNTRPQDFVGKTIRITAQDATHLHAMMGRLGIRPDQYAEVNLPSDIAVFASGQAPVWSVYSNNFVVTLQQAGYKLNFIYPDDYGVHFYADGIFTSAALPAKNPDLVRCFLRATLFGDLRSSDLPRALSYDATSAMKERRDILNASSN